jgi:hypothetical protein
MEELDRVLATLGKNALRTITVERESIPAPDETASNLQADAN